MLDLSVIILTKDESMHIRRCLENVNRIARKVYVIDCFSTDGTQEIARELGAEVVEHKWPGNQAEQFNWALDNIQIDTEWILRLDADEYMMPELVDELQRVLPVMPDAVTGVVFKRRHIFMDKWMKGGIYPVKILRLFRRGYGRYEQRLMDEHVVLSAGEEYECQNDFCDHNLNNLSWFCKKHVDYAVREAAELLDLEFGLTSHSTAGKLSEQANAKRRKKHSYARKPLFWRSFAYFMYRYFLKGGWRDGREGFIFTFIQGWWYRTLVDAKIYEIKRKCGEDLERIKSLLETEYGVRF
ncbi:MAG: glycosyltransferase family 2 protein [Muribaculaceae bacterium]|nr:glycosyltransferase family 2 protein [Muribaculaceae bacterium]